MPNTYTQLHIHFVFAVKFRHALLGKSWRSELFMYMAGIVRNQGHKVIGINGVEDHVHVLIGLNTDQSVSSLMRTLKSDSSEWINKRKFCRGLFRWQEGYSAFAISRSEMGAVAKYIQEQEEHHAILKFRDEHIALLVENGIDYDERYLPAEPT